MLSIYMYVYIYIINSWSFAGNPGSGAGDFLGSSSPGAAGHDGPAGPLAAKTGMFCDVFLHILRETLQIKKSGEKIMMFTIYIMLNQRKKKHEPLFTKASGSWSFFLCSGSRCWRRSPTKAGQWWNYVVLICNIFLEKHECGDSPIRSSSEQGTWGQWIKTIRSWGLAKQLR